MLIEKNVQGWVYGTGFNPSTGEVGAGGSQKERKKEKKLQGREWPNGRAPAWKPKSLRAVLITKTDWKRRGGEGKGRQREEEPYNE